MVVGHDVCESAGGLDESEPLGSTEVFDLWLRIARLSSSFRHIPLPLCTPGVSFYLISATDAAGD